MKSVFSLSFADAKMMGFITIAVLVITFPYQAFCADSLEVKARIPWGWINDFEFYQDGIFITPYESNGIGYFTIDTNYTLNHRYTIFPVPSASHMLVQCCIADSFLFALDGSPIHPNGEPVFFTYRISDSNCTFLAGLEPTGTVWPTGFDPIVYHNGNIIYSDYPKTFVRINVTDPVNPYVTAKLVNQDYDVCLAILPYEDTLLITSRQCGTGNWSGNFRLIRNNEPDTLISLSRYGTNRYSYTAGIININSILFTAHHQGLVAYDISDFGNVHEIYFYSTAWARFIEQVNNYIFMSCNNGWHLFKYVSPSDIQHLQYLANDERILWMKLRPGYDELWCFVDEGTLGGLAIFDLSDFVGIKEATDFAVQDPGSEIIRVHPNPFRKLTTISFGIGQSAEGIELRICDVTGRLVKQFDHKTIGLSNRVAWNGTDNLGHRLPVGVYFLQLETEEFNQTKKMVFLR